MAATHLNHDLPNTAARYVAKAMGRVNPIQRRELLEEIIRQAQAGLDLIHGIKRAA